MMSVGLITVFIARPEAGLPEAGWLLASSIETDRKTLYRRGGGLSDEMLLSAWYWFLCQNQ